MVAPPWDDYGNRSGWSRLKKFHLLNLAALHFFQLAIRKKAGHFKWKAGKRDGAKKREFTLESGNVDIYEDTSSSW